MEEHIPGFNREWLTISGAETLRDTLLARTKVPKEGWPQKPAPKPPKRISEDTAQVTLRGTPASDPVITLTDPRDPRPFYDATFLMSVSGITVEVTKSGHQREELERECQAFEETADLQVSGIMTNSGSREDCDLLVLVDKWFPITEEANAAA